MCASAARSGVARVVVTSSVASIGPAPPDRAATERNPVVELTDREHEVLRLIADGLNNSTIGERLFISEKTVKRHVSNILGKLHLVDRTQAAVYAWREGLVHRD